MESGARFGRAWAPPTGLHPGSLCRLALTLLPRSVPDECPAAVRDLILDCLETRPSRRPSALQLVERLLAAPAAPPDEQQRSSLESGGVASPERSSLEVTPPPPLSPKLYGSQPPGQQGLGQAEQEQEQAQRAEQASAAEAAGAMAPPAGSSSSGAGAPPAAEPAGPQPGAARRASLEVGDGTGAGGDGSWLAALSSLFGNQRASPRPPRPPQ